MNFDLEVVVLESLFSSDPALGVIGQELVEQVKPALGEEGKPLAEVVERPLGECDFLHDGQLTVALPYLLARRPQLLLPR